MALRSLKNVREFTLGRMTGAAAARGARFLSLAWTVACVVVTLAAFNIGTAGPSHAACPPGYGTCPNLDLCYPLNSSCCSDGAYEAGSECCQGGGACRSGFHCWGGAGVQTICCPEGSVGYKDGGCAPSTASDYCGNNRYCNTGTCCNGGLSCCS